MAGKKKTLTIKRKLERVTGSLHTSVGRVNQEPKEVPAGEAQELIDLGLAVLVGEPDDDAGEADVQATANE